MMMVKVDNRRLMTKNYDDDENNDDYDDGDDDDDGVQVMKLCSPEHLKAAWLSPGKDFLR